MADDIEVHVPGDSPSDTDVARRAAEMLDRAVDVPEGSVKAAVHHRIVTLSDEVYWQHQGDAAHRAVADFTGVVTAAVNSIKITPKPSVPDITSVITGALLRNARVEGRDVDVTAAPDGTVALTGAADSSHERAQAEHAAWAAPGVTAVDNLMRVRK